MRITLAIFCVISLSATAQLETYLTSPSWIEYGNFLGSNYLVYNVQYSGSPLSRGQFDANGTNIGLDKGIILTTGTIYNNGKGPHGPNNDGGAGQDNNQPGSALLTALIGGTPTYDASILEFDFEAIVDSISFRYVFGSEEYLEYVGSTYNDVFGIFISGPGIVGTELLTTLPNLDVVSINNVNPNSNSQYYQENGDGSQAPYNSSNTYIQYDGFTKNTVARKTGLQTGETYHLTIAIADAGDGILDAGLFVESCSACDYNVGIEETDKLEIKLHPNPANDILYIEKQSNEISTLQIRSMNGELAKELSIIQKKTSLDISEMNSGIYFVSIQSGNQISRSKLVISN